MPQPGQKTVTLNKDVYEKAKKKADKQNKSVAGFVTDLIEQKTKPAKEANPT